MRPFLPAVAAFFLLTAATAAQTITISPRADSAPGSTAARAQPLRVQVSIQIVTPFANSASAEEQDRMLNAARERLYRSAASECQILGEVFKAECRLTSLNAGGGLQDRGAAPVINANGNATYELQPRDR